VALPKEVAEELTEQGRNGLRTSKSRTGRGAGSQERDPVGRLGAAAEAYERDRYADALRITKKLLVAAPGSTAVRELHGLACYRLGKWEEAIRHLEIVVAGSREPDQVPVLMDCNRALGRNKAVEDLWIGLKASSPDADVLVEGRLVLASARAGAGDVAGGIDLLVSSGAARSYRHPAERHLRQWYLLGDLLEKSGDIAGAREMFSRVVRADPEVADAADRLAGLGRTKNRQRAGSKTRQAGYR
jgi:tetratricopeptide (TPR) repeat protein